MEYLVSIITFVLGLVVAEIIRRLNRSEALNIQIYEKRLNVYIELYQVWENTYLNMRAFVEVLNQEKRLLSSDDFFQETFYIVEPLAKFLDKMSLMLSEELKIQCGAVYLAYECSDNKGYDYYLKYIEEQNLEIKQMIKSEIGIDKLNKNMKKMMKYNHHSPIISYYKNLKNNME